MTLSVIGMGKLGLPIALVFAQQGHKIIAIDKNEKLITSLIKRKFRSEEPYVMGMLRRHSNRIFFTTCPDYFGDLTLIVVPTPSDTKGKFKSVFIEEALTTLPVGQVVVVVSTLMPGDMDRLVVQFPHLKLVYNPTFIALGSVVQDFQHTDLRLIGCSSIELATTVAKQLYPNDTSTILTPLEAELAKLCLNCYVTTKITFANQVGNLCHRLGISPNRILEAVGKDSRVGPKYFKSGLGYGGPCFPRDNIALSEFMKDHKANPRLFVTINNLNNGQVHEIVTRIRTMKPQPAKISMPSVSYKKGTDVTECSQLVEIKKWLRILGYRVVKGKGDINVTWGGIE